MKKSLTVFLTIVLCVTMISCTRQNQVYVKQENISLNYNNIVNGGSWNWLTNDAAYFWEDNLFFAEYYAIDSEGKKTITKGGLGRMQVYGNTLYVLDYSGDYGYLRSYDLVTKEEREIGKFSNVEEFFVIDDSVLFLIREVTEEEIVSHIKLFSLKTKDFVTLCEDVVAVGVIDKNPVYITKTGLKYSIYQYDISSEVSTLLGAFDVLPENAHFGSGFNFTKNYIVSKIENTEDDSSELFVYDFSSQQAKKLKVAHYVTYVVAYDKFAFFVECNGDGSDSSLETSTVYRICLEDLTIEKVVELKGWIDLFVTSDNDVYVFSTELDGIMHYNASGLEENIIKTN